MTENSNTIDSTSVFAAQFHEFRQMIRNYAKTLPDKDELTFLSVELDFSIQDKNYEMATGDLYRIIKLMIKKINDKHCI